MNKKREILINKIGEDAVRHDWVNTFGGKSYGNQHLYRVNKIASFLMEKEGGNPEVVILGAWVHDVALSAGSDYDENKVERETRKFLDKYVELDEDLKERVINCAMNHESELGVKLVEARIVHDADALDKCGALGVVRHIWKMTNMLENRLLKGKKDFLILKNHLLKRQSHLQTKTALVLAKKLNKQGNIFFEDEKVAIQIMEEISKKANDGMISDMIVDWLIKSKKSDWIKNLNKQILCNYMT